MIRLMRCSASCVSSSMVASDERVTMEPPPVISAIRTARCASLCASAAARASLSLA